jgi:Asp-tRNA(Asn)/Glu-tRNA(Gln) amidotransferase B subunit
LRVDGRDVGRLIAMIGAGTLSTSAAKAVLARMVADGGSPADIANAAGLLQQSDTDDLRALVDQTLLAHPGPVSQYRAGRKGALGFLVGRVMNASGGRANPGVVDRLVRERLAGPDGG